MELDTEPINLNHPFNVREDLIWQFDVLILVQDNHHYDGEQIYSEFFNRCGYDTYSDLVEAGQEETVSFVQAHTYLNLCAYISTIFEKPFDLEHQLLQLGVDDDGNEVAISPTSKAIMFVVELYHHVQSELDVKGAAQYSLEEKTNKLIDALESSATMLQFFGELLESNAKGGEPRWTDLHKDIYDIYLFCTIIGEHLEGFYMAVHPSQETRSAPREWPDASFIFRDALIASGICPKEVRTIGLQRWPATVIAYLRNMHDPIAARKHKDCTLQHCPHETVDNDSYRTQHIRECLGCEDIILDRPGGMISQCFEQGYFPVISFEFKDNPDGSLQVLTNVECLDEMAKSRSNITKSIEDDLPSPTVEGIQYVAISHVWSDGLGNSKGNSLPTCQVMRLQKLVDDLEVQSQKPTLFWIDTLCVPHIPTYRRQAIKFMKTIYASAARVLVLDATLSNIPARYIYSYPEALLVKLLVCPWTRRLWTYQEAQCAAEVVFQFSGAALYLQQILQRIAATHVNSQQDAMVASIAEIEKKSVFKLDVILTSGMNFIFPFMTDPTAPLQPLWVVFLKFARALYVRRTSHLRDEAVCLAALLGTSPNMFNDVADHLCMKVLIKSFRELPVSIVFFRGPRYEEEGDRWIPRSFLMGLAEPERLDEIPYGWVRHQAEGVRANLAGIRFKLDENFPKAVIYKRDMIPIILQDRGRPIFVEDPDPEFEWATLKNTELALVFHDTIYSPNTNGYNRRVILVSVKREEGDWLHVRFERNIQVNLGFAEEILLDVSYIEAEALNSQKWCIG